MHTVITQRSVQVISYISQWAKHSAKVKLQIRSFLEEITLYTVEYAVVLFFPFPTFCHWVKPLLNFHIYKIYLAYCQLIVFLAQTKHPQTGLRRHSWGKLSLKQFPHTGKQLCRTLSWIHSPRYAKKRSIQLYPKSTLLSSLLVVFLVEVVE